MSPTQVSGLSTSLSPVTGLPEQLDLRPATVAVVDAASLVFDATGPTRPTRSDTVIGL